MLKIKLNWYLQEDWERYEPETATSGNLDERHQSRVLGSKGVDSSDILP